MVCAGIIRMLHLDFGMSNVYSAYIDFAGRQKQSSSIINNKNVFSTSFVMFSV